MNVRLERLGAACVIVAEGRLDFGAAAGFQAEVEAALAAAGQRAAVIVDCTGLTYVSSAGLRVFMIAARHSKQGGLRFAVCGLQPAVRDVFELSGFSRVMTVHANRTEALAAAAQGAA